MSASPAASHQLARSSRLAPAAAPARDTILIVEDDECIAGLLRLLLAPLAARVLRARDGAEALQLFQGDARAIALVLMDCGLPDAHGDALCLRLRNSAPGLPLLLTSGRAQPAVVDLLAADGPTAFLAKPFRPGEAVQHVRALLAARAAA